MYNTSSGLCWDSRSRWNSSFKAMVVGGSSAAAPSVNSISFSGKVGNPCYMLIFKGCNSPHIVL